MILRATFAFFLLVHGLVHLMGFTKAFGYGNTTRFTREISQPAGICWAIAALLFIVALILYFFKKEWWFVALPAVLLSQVLIYLVWYDARFGTIANVVILLIGVISYADWKFDRMVTKEVESLLNTSVSKKTIVTPAMISPLPTPVQRWLLRSGVPGKELIQTVLLKQKGAMRTKPDGKWMNFEATQYFTVNPPGFNWQVKVEAMPGIYLTGRDKYENGNGEMVIKLLSLKDVANSGGTKEVNQSTLLRYLAESCWFPTAALSPYIKWESLNNSSAKATIRSGEITAEGIFYFNDTGDLSGFEAMRYGDFKGITSLEKWHIENKEYRVFEGLRIPNKSEVTWKLNTGDFTWLKLELTEVQYNRTQKYD